MPRMPAPIVTHDGTDKHDGARQAAKPLVAKLRQDPPHRTCLVTADRLRAHAPHSETLHAHGLHDILGVKAGAHPSLCQQVQAAEHAGRVTTSARHARAVGVVPRCRLVHALPLHAAHTDVRVHCIASWEGGDAQVQHCSGVTDFRVRKRNVYQLMRGGRARWTIATETCKTLQNQGDHVAHTYGHGAQPLAVVCAMRMLLAFVVDQAQQLCGALCPAVWAQLGRKRLVWERRRAVCSPDALASMRPRCEALLDGLKKPTPVLGFDAASSPAMPSVTACQSTTRRLSSGVGTVCRDHTRSPFAARHPRIADRTSLFKRRHWMGDTLCTLSTAMGLIGLLDYERELLVTPDNARPTSTHRALAVVCEAWPDLLG